MGDVSNKPLARSAAKNMPLEKTSETMATIPEDEVVDDKVRQVEKLQEKLKKAHLIITHLLL